MKKIFLLLFTFLTTQVMAQHKTDVLVLGTTPAGVSAAIQSARSGVKALLLSREADFKALDHVDFNEPAFAVGLWKEWQDSCKNDTLKIGKAKILQDQIVAKTKSLTPLYSAKLLAVKASGKNWVATIERNGKKESIRAKVIVDAEQEKEFQAIQRFNLLPLQDGKINGLTTLSKDSLEQVPNHKIYRTSAAAGFGKEKDQLIYVPLGVFISRDKPNIIALNNLAALTGFSETALSNTALWINIGQMVGAVAAFGPFFNTTIDKADVRTTQNEVLGFKGIIYPVTDVKEDDYAFTSIQQIIGAQFLSHSFKDGKFEPDRVINKEEVRLILSELYPRSRIWFLEHPDVQVLTLEQSMSLLSFISGKENYVIQAEVEKRWKKVFKFEADLDLSKELTKKELAVLVSIYLNPFSVRVNMEGTFIR
ncbi:hypothetical protein [Pseudopedobacter beijingensis]|uniref:FAD dependent oxidoreductase n=1 Tax=Pseudopedobacter beijingensis TaxID=1207056 RepID=A0ABW4I9Z4_9SPHI